MEIIRTATGGDQVRDAIINCMTEINKDSKYKVKSKIISGKLSDKGHGTYTAPAGEVWKDVTLDITTDSGEEVPTTTQAYDLHVDINTENKVWKAEEEHGKGARWGDVTVDIDLSQAYGGDNIKDNIVITTENLDDTGTYSANQDGYDAFRSITFSNVDPVSSKGGYIGEGGVAMYPITFVDSDGTYIGKKDFPNNTAYDYPISDELKNKHAGMNFKGWSGSGRATREDTVKASWGSPSIDINEISDDWSKILADSSDYPIGSYKSIIIEKDVPYSMDKQLFPNDEDIPTTGSYHYSLSCFMMKVAEGEAGSRSTWLSCLPQLRHYGEKGSSSWTATNMLIPGYCQSLSNRPGDDPWGESNGRKWLNGTFLNYILPQAQFSGIKPVTKWYKIRNSSSDLFNQSCIDSIWLPSVKEMYIPGWDNASDKGDWSGDGLSAYVTNANGESYMVNVFGNNASDGRKTWMTRLNNNGGNCRSRDHHRWPNGPVEYLFKYVGNNPVNEMYVPDPFTTGQIMTGYTGEIFGFCSM